jgi:tRNA U38,U39,U40 pseudouridine synthase TruA
MGKHEPEAIREILEGRMKRIGRTAGPEGLYLEKVYFDERGKQ